MSLILLIIFYVLIFTAANDAPPEPRYPWWEKEESRRDSR